MIRVLIIAAATASLVAQLAFFVGFGFLVSDLHSLSWVVTPEMRADSGSLTPYIIETLESYGPVTGVGIAGAVTSYVMFLRSKFRAPWFLLGTRVAGWFWLLFFPIGTLVGVVLLSARRSAIEKAQPSD